MPNMFEQSAPQEPRETGAKEKIEHYLAESLPPSEKRISETMDPRCEVSVVIPSAGERKYFFRPIESLLNQVNVKPEQFEIIMVINNSQPKQKPKEPDDVFQERVAQANIGAAENQEVLKVAQLLMGEKAEVDLSDKEHALIRRIRDAKLRVYAVDKASEGQTLSSEKANVGGARNRGVAEAVERFVQIGKNGLIVQTDADTALDEHFLERAIGAFKANPELTGASGYLEMDTEAEQDDRMKEVHFFAGMDRLYRTLLNYYSTKEQDLPKRRNFTGANMISRAYQTGMVGGVPEIGEKEDVEFGRRLDSIGKTMRLSAIIARPVDRISLRTAGTLKGHGHIRATMAKEIATIGEITVDSVEYTETVDRIEQAAMAAKDLETFKQAMIFRDVPLLPEPEMQELFASIQSGTPKKELLYKVYDQVARIIPRIPILKASQQLLARLCEQESLCEKYMDELVQPTKPLAIEKPAGINAKHLDMYKKLKAMDTAKRG